VSYYCSIATFNFTSGKVSAFIRGLWQLLSKRCTRHGRDSATAISSGQAFKVKPVHHFLDKINRLLATPQYYQNVNKNPSLVELAS
jgi:hypothetical protein